MQRAAQNIHAFTTRSLLTHTAILHAELSTAITCSSVLIARGRHRRGERPLGCIRGGSSGDVALITTTIAEIPLCIDCIVRKTGAPIPDVAAALRRIGTTFNVAQGDSCHGCLKHKPTFCLDGH
jgi:hypothetical protein